jgi:aryl-alcohol dehydrogenase-like predicted oxidoreductase
MSQLNFVTSLATSNFSGGKERFKLEFKQLGQTNVKIPSVGFAWGIGGEMKSDSSHDKEGTEAIRKAVELGMSLVDTGELYGDGHCEEVIGEAIKVFDREKYS